MQLMSGMSGERLEAARLWPSPTCVNLQVRAHTNFLCTSTLYAFDTCTDRRRLMCRRLVMMHCNISKNLNQMCIFAINVI